MGFTNLKRNSLSAIDKAVTLDEFIDDAELYARGKSRKPHLRAVTSHPGDIQVGVKEGTPSPEPMKRANFTLTGDALNRLIAASEETGISRSRLIRIWLDQLSPEQLAQFTRSTVK